MTSIETDNPKPTHPDIRAALAYALISRPYLNLSKLMLSKVTLSNRIVELSFTDTYSTKATLAIELQPKIKELSFNV